MTKPGSLEPYWQPARQFGTVLAASQAVWNSVAPEPAGAAWCCAASLDAHSERIVVHGRVLKHSNACFSYDLVKDKRCTVVGFQVVGS